MKQWFWLVSVAGLAVASSGSLAFDQQGGASAPQAGQTTAQTVAPGVQLQVPDMPVGRDKGTEVRIPGLGLIGVLPKMDFGLELLYGANDRGMSDPSKGAEIEKSDSGEFAVKGRVMRKF